MRLRLFLPSKKKDPGSDKLPRLDVSLPVVVVYVHIVEIGLARKAQYHHVFYHNIVLRQTFQYFPNSSVAWIRASMFASGVPSANSPPVLMI